jgi:hypothetical protein
MGLNIRNGAEAQVSGTAVAAGGGNTGGGADVAFDEAVTGVNMVMNFDNGHPLTGLNAYMIQQTTVATVATYLGWTSAVIGAPVRRMFGGLSYWANIVPVATVRLIEFFNGATVIGWIGVASGGGNLHYRTAADAQLQTASTATSASTLYRIEFDAFFSTAGASGRVWVYNDSTGVRLAADGWFGAVAWGTNAGCDHVRFGLTTGNFSSTANDTLSIDDIWISDQPRIWLPPRIIIPKLAGTPVQPRWIFPSWRPDDAAVGGTTFNQNMVAIVTAVAAIQNTVSKNMLATVTTVPSMLKTVSKNMLASVTATAIMQKTVSKLLSAPVTLSAKIQKTVGKNMSANVTLVGAMVRTMLFTKNMVATVTLVPSMTKTVSKNMLANVTINASMLKTVLKNLLATVTINAAMQKTVSKLMRADVTVVATLAAIKSILVSMVATVTVQASMQKTVAKNMLASVNVTASMQRTISKLMSASVNVTASMKRTVSKNMLATVNVIAAIAKTIPVKMVATVNVVASLQATFVPFVGGAIQKLRMMMGMGK